MKWPICSIWSDIEPIRGFCQATGVEFDKCQINYSDWCSGTIIQSMIRTFWQCRNIGFWNRKIITHYVWFINNESSIRNCVNIGTSPSSLFCIWIFPNTYFPILLQTLIKGFLAEEPCFKIWLELYKAGIHGPKSIGPVPKIYEFQNQLGPIPKKS